MNKCPEEIIGLCQQFSVFTRRDIRVFFWYASEKLVDM
jgi:hypothetical protein